MKFAVGVPMDQTFCYMMRDGVLTTKPMDAALCDSLEEADVLAAMDDEAFVERVEDEAAFRAGKATW